MAESDVNNSIKKARLSHISAPVNDDAEFHLRDSELSEIPEDGQEGHVCFPVKTVNHGSDSGLPMHRFVQIGKADFHSKDITNNALDKGLKKASDKVRKQI